MVLVIVNVIISSCLILSSTYTTGKGSVTGIISSVLLLLPRAAAWLSSTRAAVHKTAGASYIFSKVPKVRPPPVCSLPLQCVLKKMRTHAAPWLSKVANRIDANWRFRKDVYKPNFGGMTSRLDALTAHSLQVVELAPTEQRQSVSSY